MTGRPYRLGRIEAPTDAQRAVVEELTAGPRGGVVGPYDAWLRRPELAHRARLLGDYCRFEAELRRDIAEIVILVVGRHWDAPFEFAAHAPLALASGVPAAVVEAIRAGARPEFTDGGQAAAYDLVTEYLGAHRVADSTYEQARAALGEERLVDVIAVAGFYALVCMTLNVFEVPLVDGMQDPFPPDPEAG